MYRIVKKAQRGYNNERETLEHTEDFFFESQAEAKYKNLLKSAKPHETVRLYRKVLFFWVHVKEHTVKPSMYTAMLEVKHKFDSFMQSLKKSKN